MATELKTTNIKGKEYVEVNERVKAFRSNPEWAGWTLLTIPHTLTHDIAILEAQVLDKDGRLIANGFAEEVRTTGGVNATSHIENCETSAWGRALGNLGIGIDKAICSAQEMLVALNSEKQAQAKPGKPIEPKKEEKAQEEAAKRDLTPLEEEEYTSALADMDAAENVDQLRDIYRRYKDAAFASKLAQHAQGIKSIRGWE